MEKELINSPKHYNNHPSTIECIELIRLMNFNIGNAVKYIFRRDDKENIIQDLKKAKWYITDEINYRNQKKFNKFFGSVTLVFNRVFRYDLYDFYKENQLKIAKLNQYEESHCIKRIYELLNDANYYFYETKHLDDALSYLSMFIESEEIKNKI